MARQRLEKWRRLDKKRTALQAKRARVIERSAGQGGDGAQVIVREVAYPGTLLIFGARRSLVLRDKKLIWLFNGFFYNNVIRQVLFLHM